MRKYYFSNNGTIPLSIIVMLDEEIFLSSLIFYTDQNQIYVATDTLAVHPNGEPMMFVSKATHIPHLNLIIAGTGQGGFANEFAFIVNSRMMLSGIENLDFHATKGLQKLWAEYKSKYDLTDYSTTTVYAFGFSEEDNQVVSYAYRSTNNFKSEKIPYGTATKPGCSIPDGEFNLDEIVPKLMHLQRDNQLTLSPDERVYIGGEINCLYLNRNNCTTYKLYTFPDYAEQVKFALANFKASS
jgi:hypothetical protein